MVSVMFPGPIRAAGVCLLLSLLAGCGAGNDAGSPAPRSVLVDLADARVERSGIGLPGEIRARHESALAFRVGGQLARRHVDIGDRVERGQLLAELDPGDQELQVQAAQAQLQAAEAELGRARADHARYSSLAAESLVSRSTLDAQTAALRAAEGQARTARSQLDTARNQGEYTRLLAPDAGVIASRQAESGQVVGAGQTIFTLAADGAREVAIALPESHLGQFAVGQAVEVELWNRAGARPLAGRIREVAPAADPQARTYAARVALDDADAAVELGQSARVYPVGARSAGRSVPLMALQPGPDGGDAVWVVDPASGQVHLQPVQTGEYGSERVEVRSGLPVGALVVAAGGHLLREGQRVQPVDRQNRPVDVPAARETR